MKKNLNSMLEDIKNRCQIARDQNLDYIAIIGPTGVGKTGCALQLAMQYPHCFEIVSVDSVQIYRGLDIGSAKVDADTRKRIPHHLIDICAADERYTAAAFAQDAIATVKAIRQRGKIALLVGGTMLYLQAFVQGLSPIAPITPTAKAQVDELLHQGLTVAWSRLKQIDLQTAQRLAPQDRCRIERALLVYYATGQTMSSWQALPRQRGHDFQGVIMAMWPEDRAVLKTQLAQRFDEMLAQGFIEEVQRCWQAHPQLTMDHPSMRAIGYRQVSTYVQGDCDYASMRHDGIIATRRYAKRQLTWMRSMPGIHKHFHGLAPWHALWQAS